MSDCIFCKIISGDIPATKVYEDAGFLAFLDIHPVSPGHTLVIPKQHYDRFETTPPEVVAELYKLLRSIAVSIAAGAGADAFNLGVNNGPAAGQVIFHTHVHVIPRKPKDGLESWGSRDYEGTEMDEVAKKIRAAIKQSAASRE
ncbi:MAG: HIT family protein [Candidatus Veblenbacteria bacterium]|nr:HIT family protein [Candidatus Veblenbacteria bacterium]MDZ4229978.1 HIT family protein [Candidatus Veblenbacteria bacterium]